ncbi:MAG: DGQHR domain-containing protein [Candidatus Zambryskibacteria bacterium]|nr:DGQHR domain-containing protein [Candidatus Zambryskibacteria bacterium]
MQTEYPFIREGQPRSELFTFVVKASDLIAFGRVERFNEAEEGVQRRLNPRHVENLAAYMKKPDASLPEPILGDLRGAWAFDGKKNVVKRQDEAHLLIDDGQQRFAALHLLSPEERERWEFKVTATLNTPYQVRLQRFVQQLKRLKLDANLVLQIQDRGNIFPDPLSKSVYHLAKRLASDGTSPLRGLVRLEERVPKGAWSPEDVEKLKSLLSASPATILREQTLGVVNVTAIMRDLRQVAASPHSLLRNHNPEQQFESLSRLFTAAQEVWLNEWNNPKAYFLRRSVGISALIQLFVIGKFFKDCLSPEGTRWNKRVTQRMITITPETISRTLGYAKNFDWSFERFNRPGMKFPTATDFAGQLDSLIYREMPKSFRPKRGQQVASV